MNDDSYPSPSGSLCDRCNAWLLLHDTIPFVNKDGVRVCVYLRAKADVWLHKLPLSATVSFLSLPSKVHPSRLC